MGNGHDTCWLCGLVGEAGRVYAFDVQPEALTRTRERLEAAGLFGRAKLYCAGHEHMAEYVAEPVDVIMFNLGWLPGTAHAVTTRVDTTLTAIGAGLELLRPDGIMTICIYPGHPEGARELDAITRWTEGLDPKAFDVIQKRYLNQMNDPPQLIAVKRNRQRHK